LQAFGSSSSASAAVHLPRVQRRGRIHAAPFFFLKKNKKLQPSIYLHSSGATAYMLLYRKRDPELNRSGVPDSAVPRELKEVMAQHEDAQRQEQEQARIKRNSLTLTIFHEAQALCAFLFFFVKLFFFVRLLRRWWSGFSRRESRANSLTLTIFHGAQEISVQVPKKACLNELKQHVRAGVCCVCVCVCVFVCV
jgi:hypothetical protein